MIMDSLRSLFRSLIQPKGWLAASILVALFLTGPMGMSGLHASAQQSTVHVSLRATRYSPGGAGGVVTSGDWVRSTARGTVAVGGTAAVQRGEPWATGRSGVTRNTRDGEVFGLSGEVGGGRAADAGSYVARLTGSWDRRIGRSALWGGLETEALDLNGDRSLLLRPGLQWQISERLLLRGRYGRSFGGETQVDYGFATAERVGERIGLLLGMLIGRSVESLTIRGTHVSDFGDHRWEVFGGVTLFPGGVPVRLLVEYQGGRASSRHSVVASSSIPVR